MRDRARPLRSFRRVVAAPSASRPSVSDGPRFVSGRVDVRVGRAAPLAERGRSADESTGSHSATASGTPYKPAAIRGYEHALRTRVLPALGHLKLSEVTRADVQDLADRMTAEGASASLI